MKLINKPTGQGNLFRTNKWNMDKEYNPTHKHKHMPNMTCEIVDTTSKGYKIRVKEGRKKSKIQYYYFVDFSEDKGVWEKIN